MRTAVRITNNSMSISNSTFNRSSSNRRKKKEKRSSSTKKTKRGKATNKYETVEIATYRYKCQMPTKAKSQRTTSTRTKPKTSKYLRTPKRNRQSSNGTKKRR